MFYYDLCVELDRLLSRVTKSVSGWLCGLPFLRCPLSDFELGLEDTLTRSVLLHKLYSKNNYLYIYGH
jgi:hypothetical protein